MNFSDLSKYCKENLDGEVKINPDNNLFFYHHTDAYHSLIVSLERGNLEIWLGTSFVSDWIKADYKWIEKFEGFSNIVDKFKQCHTRMITEIEEFKEECRQSLLEYGMNVKKNPFLRKELGL